MRERMADYTQDDNEMADKLNRHDYGVALIWREIAVDETSSLRVLTALFYASGR